MYDFSAQVSAFHDEYIRLTRDQRSDMRDRREKNLKRIRNGLQSQDKPEVVQVINQGGYAQKTMVQPPEGDEETRYDIDLGVVFEADASAGARTTRGWVRDAIAEKASGMKNDPECKPKCVRVVYSDGYQCDFPVFQRTESWKGSTYELAAGNEWVDSDPAAMNAWVEDRITSLSPQTTGARQLRRIIRYVKYIAKVHAYRSSTKYPGGLLVTALAIEGYKAREGRDDTALRETLRSIGNRSENAAVYANGIQISDAKDVPRLKRLIDKCERLVESLDELEGEEVSDSDARKKWKKVFRHEYFSEAELETKSARVSAVPSGRERSDRLQEEARARRAAGGGHAPWSNDF